MKRFRSGWIGWVLAAALALCLAQLPGMAEGSDFRLDVRNLLEDSEFIRVQTAPNTLVQVVRAADDEEIASGESDGDGMFSYPLAEIPDDRKPRQGEEIIVRAGGASEPIEVGEARRRQITAKVKEQGDDSVVSESITVAGNAEPESALRVWWIPDMAEPRYVDTNASVNGWYEVSLPGDNLAEAWGVINVEYADGLAKSKSGGSEIGHLRWEQVAPTPEPTPEPTPSPTPTPTPEPSPTPTPTPEPSPTPTPTPEPTEAPKGMALFINNITGIFGGPEKIFSDWRFWAMVAAVLIAAALLVVLLLRSRNKKAIPTYIPDDEKRREGEYAEAGTMRERGFEPSGETLNMPTYGKMSGALDSPVNLGVEDGNAGAGGGTVRLSAWEGNSAPQEGTVRISEAPGPKAMIVHVNMRHEWTGETQDATLSIIEEVTVGRSEKNDLTIHDETVSGKHLKLIRRERDLYALDLMSSNGTKLNGQRMTIETKLNSGDELLIGRTILTVSFE